jgi:hypothetical protein
VGTVAAIATLVGIAINGVYMLVSPRAWFRLPAWFRFQGSLRPDRYSSGWGAIQVRLLGFAFVALLLWVAFSMIGIDPHIRQVFAKAQWLPRSGILVGRLALIVVGLYGALNAAYMLISPRAWFRLPAWLRVSTALSLGQHSAVLEAVSVRLTGLLMFVALVVIAFVYLTRY